MTIVRYVGDIHGSYRQFVRTIRDVPLSVQIGDYGFGFGPLPMMLLGLNDQDGGKNHRFIRGNHDSPAECAAQKNWIKDGQFEQIDGRNVMYIGGAFSIDKEWRTPGVSWWEDEELSANDLYLMIDYYDAYKPEVMVTHECPDSLVEPLMRSVNPNFQRFPVGSRTRDAFDTMFNSRHQPKVWIFGHWHEPVDMVIGNTRFICIDCNNYIDVNYEDLSITPQTYIDTY